MYAEGLVSRDILCELFGLGACHGVSRKRILWEEASTCFRFGSQNWKGFRFKTPPNTTERYSIRIFSLRTGIQQRAEMVPTRILVLKRGR